jgi:group I intron endonuclease
MQIYKTTNNINGKIYIGKNKTNNKNYLGSGIVLNFAIKKYGRENFSKEIIEECETYQMLNEQETYWISFYDSTNSKIGYNRSKGGDGFSGITQETINKIISKNTGKKRTQECKDKLSLIAKDKPKSSEHKKSLSKAWEKRKIDHPHTKDTLDKMSKSMLGKNAKNTYKLTNGNGEEFVVSNLSQFIKDNKLQGIQLYKVMKGERKSSLGWKCTKII